MEKEGLEDECGDDTTRQHKNEHGVARGGRGRFPSPQTVEEKANGKTHPDPHPSAHPQSSPGLPNKVTPKLTHMT